MTQKKDKNKECGLVVFHATTKENMKTIMKEGLKPGMKGGWCDMFEKTGLTKVSTEKDIEFIKQKAEDFRIKCKENTSVSGSLDGLEALLLVNEINDIDTVAIICIPQKNARIRVKMNEKSFEDFDTERLHQRGADKGKERFLSEKVNYNEVSFSDYKLTMSEYEDILIKENIPPENIIGCLDIVKENNKITNIHNKEGFSGPNRHTYRINKECRFD